MKIAICFSGQIRTGLECYDNFIRYIGDLYQNCNFFCHTWSNENYSSPGFTCKFVKENNILPLEYWDIDKEKIFKFSEKYSMTTLMQENIHIWTSIPGLSPMQYGVYMSNKLKRMYEESNNMKFDYVIRTRPDLVFSETKSLFQDILELENDNKRFLYAQLYNASVVNNQIDNAFWIGSSDVMDVACSFGLIRANAHPSNSCDEHIHFGNWLIHGVALDVRRMTNSNVSVYRYYHRDDNISPIDYSVIANTMSADGLKNYLDTINNVETNNNSH